MKNGNDYKTAILKKSRVQNGFLSVDFICNIICYVVYFSLTKQIPTAQPFLQAQGYKPSQEHGAEGEVEKRLYSEELFFFLSGYFIGWVGAVAT